MLNKFISTEEAARRSGHHPAYLENLCGAGKIDAVLLGNIWLVSPVSFSSFLAESDAKKAAIARMAQEPHRGNCCSAMKSPPAFQNVFQAQAFSALVAISVLLGGLFAAHSEFLEQVVVHAGNEALSFVYDTRAAVLRFLRTQAIGSSLFIHKTFLKVRAN